MQENSRINWGILSTAKIGVEQVIPAIAKSNLGNVSAISSRDIETAREIASQFGIERVYGTYEELLMDPKIVSIYNPLPNHLHVDWTIKAVEAGKHVLCEKPLGMDAKDVQRLSNLRTDKLIMEAFMIRFHPQWKRAKEIVDSGALGDVRIIQVYFGYHNDDPGNIRNKVVFGGGALLDIGCYAIVTGRFLYGMEPERVISLIDRDPVFKTDRVTSGLLDFGEGRRLDFTVSTQGALFQRVQIVGTRARLEIAIPFNPPSDQKMTIYHDNGSDLTGGSICPEEIEATDQYANQIDEFSQSILEKRSPPYGLHDAVNNMKIIDALFKSETTGQWEKP